MSRGQSAFEYLLLIGAGVLVSAILLVIVTNTQTTTTDVVTNDTQDYAGKLKNLLSTGGTTDCRYCDGIFVGVDKENSITSTMIVDGSITSSDVNPTQIQLRITKDCGTQAISRIDATGNATCIPVTAGATTWTTNGNNQYSANTGNIGIGTANPTTKLAVNGNASITGATTINGPITLTGTTINGNANITGTTTLTGATLIKGTATINGTINATNHTITGLAAPVDASDAATKEYVDASNVQGAYNACYILKSTSSGVACAAGFTRLAHFNGGDACWTLDNPLGATNSLSTYFTMGAAVINFDVGFAHYSYGSSNIVTNWGAYNIGLGDCVGYSGWAGSLTPVVLWTTNGVAQGFNTFINRATAQTMAICCK